MMNRTILYIIIVAFIIGISFLGWYYFSPQGFFCMMSKLGIGEAMASCGGGGGGGVVPTVFECVTNQDCEPKEFNPDVIGTFFTCTTQYKCINSTAEDIESIVCSINENCPYGYECYEGSCLVIE